MMKLVCAKNNGIQFHITAQYRILYLSNLMTYFQKTYTNFYRISINDIIYVKCLLTWLVDVRKPQ